jgi:hypothetical protein
VGNVFGEFHAPFIFKTFFCRFRKSEAALYPLHTTKVVASFVPCISHFGKVLKMLPSWISTIWRCVNPVIIILLLLLLLLLLISGDPINYYNYFIIDYTSGTVNKTSNITDVDPHNFVIIIQVRILIQYVCSVWFGHLLVTTLFIALVSWIDQFFISYTI